MPSSSEVGDRSKRAARWSLATELLAKVISPISQLILVRLLDPTAFGMVATVTMVVSFADMFSDAGFQKYLVQHEFASANELHLFADVAFWTNFAVSIALWLLIAVFRDPISSFVGSPSMGVPLAVACGSLPLTSFSSIQRSLFQRGLDFKAIMPARLSSALLTLAVTVTLALMGSGYWALIIGTLSGNLATATILTAKSRWKPRLRFSCGVLMQMLSFSLWTLVESITIWLSTWAGSFIIGNALGPEVLGLYRTPVTLINGCFSVVTGATTPILFSALSRLQGNMEDFFRYLYKFQAVMSLFLVPLSVGLFVFRDFIVLMVLGDQWGDSVLAFGVYGLLQGPMVLLSYYCSEMYRSLGRPMVSTMVQIAFMAFMIPVMMWATRMGFNGVVWADAVSRLFLLLTNQVVAHVFIGTDLTKIAKTLVIPCLGSATMAFVAFVTQNLFAGGLVLEAVRMLCSAAAYAVVVLMFPTSRRILFSLTDAKAIS